MTTTMKLRPSVLAFAIEMEKKLRTRDAEYGPEGWVMCSQDFLHGRLHDEVKELDAAVKIGPRSGRFARVVNECIDIANFAMMIADTNGLARAVGDIDDLAKMSAADINEMCLLVLAEIDGMGGVHPGPDAPEHVKIGRKVVADAITKAAVSNGLV